MKELRGALIGCGFFAVNQLNGWRDGWAERLLEAVRTRATGSLARGDRRPPEDAIDEIEIAEMGS